MTHTHARKKLIIEGGEKVFLKNLAIADPIPREAISKVTSVLESANLYRYIGKDASESEVALLEREFAEYVGARYALAFNSCSSALFVSLLCVGVKPGDKVLVPAFTFAAVPSAIVHAQAQPVLVECDSNYCINVIDLKQKITPETKFLLLSHMRGHVSDLDEIIAICEASGITLIEDAAHSLGVLWDGVPTGTLGRVGCYSFQSYKIINAGEGGILVTDDEEVIVKAIIYSGAFEKLWMKHFVESDLFVTYQKILPVYNVRMSNVTAAIVRPQIPLIDIKVPKYIHNYTLLADILSASEYFDVPKRSTKERIAPDSIQFNLKHFSKEEALQFMELARMEGISFYVFGVDEDNVRAYWNWRFLPNVAYLPLTEAMLHFACDVRLPIYLDNHDISAMGTIFLSIADYIKRSS